MKWYDYLLIVIIFLAGYFLGSYSEESSWLKKETAYKEQLLQLQQTIQTKQKEYAELSSNIQTQLADAKRLYEAKLSNVSSSYANQLQQSEQRAKLYQSQATKGEAERRSLASHAAELDKSLTEGRRVVEELTEHIRFRDAQCILLGKQITIERKVNE